MQIYSGEQHASPYIASRSSIKEFHYRNWKRREGLSFQSERGPSWSEGRGRKRDSSHLGQLVGLKDPGIPFSRVSLHQFAPGHSTHAILHRQLLAGPAHPRQPQHRSMTDTPAREICRVIM